MKKEEMHLEFLYDKAFQHFKEQDQLRNAIIGFFATITGAFSIIDSNLDITIVGFLALIGLLLAFVLCRYKYFGEIYLITMNTIIKIWGDDTSETITVEQIHELLKKQINAYNNILLKKLFSADFLIYSAFNLVNSLNIYKVSFCVLDLFIFKEHKLLFEFLSLPWTCALILTALYLLIMTKVYDKFVLQNVKNATPSHFSFLNFK